VLASSGSEPALHAWQVIEGKIQISILLPVTGQRAHGLHGLVALPNSREVDILIAAGVF